MKKPQQPQEPAHVPESPVLRNTFAFADMWGNPLRQHFVIRTILPNIGDSMQRAQTPEREGQTSDDAKSRPQPPAWEDGSGEGAASALESLRKLEQKRRSNRPADDRPAAE